MMMMLTIRGGATLIIFANKQDLPGAAPRLLSVHDICVCMCIYIYIYMYAYTHIKLHYGI